MDNDDLIAYEYQQTKALTTIYAVQIGSDSDEYIKLVSSHLEKVPDKFRQKFMQCCYRHALQFNPKE